MSLLQIQEQFGHLNGGFRAFGQQFQRLNRRYSIGGMRCGQNFVGLEPAWHREKREAEAKAQAERRAAKKGETTLAQPTDSLLAQFSEDYEF